MADSNEDRNSRPGENSLRDMIRQWKAAMEEGNRYDLEVNRRRTPAERLHNLQTFLDTHAQYGLEIEKAEDRAHRTPYAVIQERWIARNTKGSLDS